MTREYVIPPQMVRLRDQFRERMRQLEEAQRETVDEYNAMVKGALAGLGVDIMGVTRITVDDERGRYIAHIPDPEVEAKPESSDKVIQFPTTEDI